MKIHDFGFKVKLVSLVLSFEGQDLVVGLLRNTLTLVGEVVKLFDAVDGASDLAGESNIDSKLVLLLLSADVDFVSESSAVSLQVVVSLE